MIQPHTPIHLFYFALINLVIVLVGYAMVKYRQFLLSWVLLVVSISAIYILFINEHAIIRMLAIIAITFTAMKVIAVTEGYRSSKNIIPFKQWFIFATGWAGMRAQPFETYGQKALPNAWPMIWFGIKRVIAGFTLILLAHLIVAQHIGSTLTYPIVSVIVLIGLSLILHFGLLSISAGAWRLHGVNTYYLFRQPAKALSLTEFWSKRWNIAFSEMTSVAIFRPLKSKIGSPAALMLAFAFSGILHELALSLPVNSGYGLPMLYFIIQGVMVLIEKLLQSRNSNFLKSTILARVWTLFWVAAPMPLLFHAQFIKQVVWPLAGF